MQEKPSKNNLFSLFVGAGTGLLCAGIAWLCHSWGDLAFFLMVYLLGAVLVGWRWGRLAAAVAAILGMLANDLLFQEHIITFKVANWPRFVVFLGLVAIAQLVADLVQKLRRQTRLAQQSERETAALYALSRQLASETTPQQLLKTAEHFFASSAMPVAPLGNLTIALPLHNGHGLTGCLQVSAQQWVKLPEGFREACLQQVSITLERLLAQEETERARSATRLEQSRHALLSAVSHDFRTPLAAIEGLASTLRLEEDHLKPEERCELAATIQMEAKRLDHLVQNLLEITRLEHDTLQLRPSLLPLESIVGAVLDRLHAPCHLVSVALPEHLPPVRVDGALIELLLTNLLQNALRHAPGAHVHLRALPQGDYVMGEVADQGPGIPASDRERIFEKFTRSAKASRDGGTGLGLAICKAIVQAHGGRIWVETAEGGGAAFRFTLPCQRAIQPEEGL